MKPLIWRWLLKAPLAEEQQLGSFINKTSVYVGMENKKMDKFTDATRQIEKAIIMVGDKKWTNHPDLEDILVSWISSLRS